MERRTASVLDDRARPWLNLEMEGRESGDARPPLLALPATTRSRVEDEVIGVGIVVVDITERKEAEDFRSVVMDNMAEGLYALDAEGRVDVHERGRVEDARLERGGATREVDARGDPLPACRRLTASRGGVRTAQGQAPRGGRSASPSDAFTRKDGSIFPVAYSAGAAAGRDGQSRSASSSSVTPREETEERLKRQRELDALTWVGRIRDALDEDRFVLYSPADRPASGGRAERRNCCCEWSAGTERSFRPGASSRSPRSTG